MHGSLGSKKRRRRTRAKPDEVCDVAKPQRVEHAAPCSVEFGRDAKGQAKWALKVYCESDEMEEAVERLLELDDRLRRETW